MGRAKNATALVAAPRRDSFIDVMGERRGGGKNHYLDSRLPTAETRKELEVILKELDKGDFKLAFETLLFNRRMISQAPLLQELQEKTVDKVMSVLAKEACVDQQGYAGYDAPLIPSHSILAEFMHNAGLHASTSPLADLISYDKIKANPVLRQAVYDQLTRTLVVRDSELPKPQKLGSRLGKAWKDALVNEVVEAFYGDKPALPRLLGIPEDEQDTAFQTSEKLVTKRQYRKILKPLLPTLNFGVFQHNFLAAEILKRGSIPEENHLTFWLTKSKANYTLKQSIKSIVADAHLKQELKTRNTPVSS